MLEELIAIVGFIVVVQLAILLRRQKMQIKILDLVREHLENALPSDLEQALEHLASERGLYKEFLHEDPDRRGLPPRERFRKFRDWKASQD